MDVTGMGYDGGRFIAANVKSQGGGRITTLSCKEQWEVDRTGTGSGALAVSGERDVERSNYDKRVADLTFRRLTSTIVDVPHC